MLKPAWIGLVPRGEADPWTYYEKYAEIGYKGMDGDLSRLEGDLLENYKRFTGLGLTPLTTVVPAGLMPGAGTFADLAADKDGALTAMIEKMHLQNMTRATAMGSSILRTYGDENTTVAAAYDAFMADIEGMNALCDKLEKEGIMLAYHNHFQEFASIFEGVPAMDHFLLKTDPRIKFDLDIGWVRVGRVDPIAFMQQVEGRIAAVHLKDFWDLDKPRIRGEGRTGFTHLGSGLVDIAGCMKEADRQGIEWVIYEQDVLRNLDYVQSMTASYLYMKETGLIG